MEILIRKKNQKNGLWVYLNNNEMEIEEKEKF